MANHDLSNHEPMLLSCTDEDGTEVTFELLDQFIYDEDGCEYALLSLPEGDSDPLAPVSTLIVRLTEDGDETILSTVGDDELEIDLYSIFEERLNDMFEFDGEEESEDSENEVL